MWMDKNGYVKCVEKHHPILEYNKIYEYTKIYSNKLSGEIFYEIYISSSQLNSFFVHRFVEVTRKIKLNRILYESC